MTSKLPTVKNVQNFLGLIMNNEDIRKHDKPQPKKTAKQTSLCVVDSLKVKRFQKLGPLVVTSSSMRDLNE